MEEGLQRVMPERRPSNTELPGGFLIVLTDYPCRSLPSGKVSPVDSVVICVIRIQLLSEQRSDILWSIRRMDQDIRPNSRNGAAGSYLVCMKLVMIDWSIQAGRPDLAYEVGVAAS